MQRIKHYRYIIFGVLAVSYVLVYFHRLCAAVVAIDMMRDLETGGALMGLLGSAYFYPYAVMQLPAGLLSDSWGPRRTITLFFSVACIGSVIQGLAPTLFWAVAGRTLVGIGAAMLFVPTMKILAEWFMSKEFALMTGFLIAMGGVGTLLATAPLAWLSDLVGWRISFIIIGIITLICAALVWLIVRDRPGDSASSPHDTAPVSGEAGTSLWGGVLLIVKEPHFWTIAVWFFFICAVFFSFGGLWGGPYIMQVYHLPKEEAGRILSMLAVGMIIGSPLQSFASNRIFRARKPVIIMATVISFLVTAVLALRTGSLTVPALYGICFCMGVFTNAIVVVGFTAAKELFPVRMAGTSTGLVNLFPFLGGALAQPLLGYLLERRGTSGGAFTVRGYEDAFMALLISMAIALVASFFIRETMTTK